MAQAFLRLQHDLRCGGLCLNHGEKCFLIILHWADLKNNEWKRVFCLLVCWNTPKRLYICFCVLAVTEDTCSTSTAVTVISSLWNRSLCQLLATKKTLQCQFLVSGKILIFLCKTTRFKAIWLKSTGHQSKNIFNTARRGPISRVSYLSVCLFVSLVKEPCIPEEGKKKQTPHRNQKQPTTTLISTLCAMLHAYYKDLDGQNLDHYYLLLPVSIWCGIATPNPSH